MVLSALSSWARGELSWIVTVFIQVSLFAAAAAVLSLLPAGRLEPWARRSHTSRRGARRRNVDVGHLACRPGWRRRVSRPRCGVESVSFAAAEFVLVGMLVTFIAAGDHRRLLRSSVAAGGDTIDAASDLVAPAWSVR